MFTRSFFLLAGCKCGPDVPAEERCPCGPSCKCGDSCPGKAKTSACYSETKHGTICLLTLFAFAKAISFQGIFNETQVSRFMLEKNNSIKCIQRLGKEWTPSKLPVLFPKCPLNFTKVNTIMKKVPITLVDRLYKKREQGAHRGFHSCHSRVMSALALIK